LPAEIGAFVRGIIKYHCEGTTPKFEDRSLNLLFSSHKEEFDHNITKYNDMVERRKSSGKKGGLARSEKKAAAARENGGKGGAPKGNRNAAKDESPDIDPENKPKPMLRLSEETTTQATQAELESENRICGSVAAAGGGEVVLEKQPETTTAF
jgi:hypothetical protein